MSDSKCFCAFCRSERAVYRTRHVSIFDALMTFSASVLLSFIVWQDFDPRCLMFFVFGLGLAEIFVVLRWRMSIACKRCGFDPVLYKRDPKLAVSKVRAHYDTKKNDPLSVLTPPPKLPVIVKKVSVSEGSARSEAMQ